MHDLDGAGALRRDLAAALDEVAPRDAAGLELLALNLIAPFLHPELTADAAELVPSALEERGDEIAAGVLAAIATLAPGPAAQAAAEARDRLARAGIEPPAVRDLGALRTLECYRLALGDGEAEMIGVVLRRPRARKVQAAIVFVEHHSCGGVIVRGLLSGPENLSSARALVRRPLPDAAAEPCEADAVAAVLRGALDHMVAHEVELPVDVLPPLLVLRRALEGDWPQPPLGQSEEILDLLREDAEELTDAFAAGHGNEAAAVADAMCHWKVDYVGGLVERWTVADLHEFLLDWYPRNGGAGEPVEAVPGAVVDFLRFLQDRGRLDGDSLETLECELESLRAPFVRAASDRRNWGPAKSMVMQMRAEGVELTEQAVARWTADFNARPFAERDRVLGTALPRPVQRRKAQRRSTKAARRRNRR